jgi:predicted RNA-binding protein YlqC (UPF0109 family)
MKEFVEYIAKELVDQTSEVEVTEVVGSKTTVYELRVEKNDLGKIIGRQGQTAKAIRTLLSAIAAKNGKRAVLEILE